MSTRAFCQCHFLLLLILNLDSLYIVVPVINSVTVVVLFVVKIIEAIRTVTVIQNTGTVGVFGNSLYVKGAVFISLYRIQIRGIVRSVNGCIGIKIDEMIVFVDIKSKPIFPGGLIQLCADLPNWVSIPIADLPIQSANIVILEINLIIGAVI